MDLNSLFAIPLKKTIVLAGGDKNWLTTSILPCLRQSQTAHEVPAAYLGAGIRAND